MEANVYKSFLPDDAKMIRQTVFITEQGFMHELDELDSEAIHIVLYDNGAPIGTCRILRTAFAERFVLGRFAVLKEYRGKGFGALMLKEAEKTVASLGGKLLSLHAQCHVTAFYEKSGYKQYGEIEYEQGCPHIHMEKPLQQTE